MRTDSLLKQLNYIESPNLPEAPVSLALVDGRIDAGIADSLEKLGISYVRTQKHPALPEDVAYHPDMMFCHIGGRDIVYAPKTCTETLMELEEYGFNLISGNLRLKSTYPDDIAYNVAIVGKYAFHDFRHTDSILRNRLEEKGFELVKIKQGYAKCSISILGGNSVITSDKGIRAAMLKHSVNTLAIEPDKNIHLGNFSNGFIGGCTGKIGSDKLAFTGDAERLGSYDIVSEFTKANNISIISLGSGNIRDMGSVIPLATY